MNCPHCGKSVVKGTAFCVHCGSPLPTGTAAPIPQVATITSGVDSAFAEQKRKQNLILGLVAVAAIILAIFGGKAISSALGFGAKSPSHCFRRPASRKETPWPRRLKRRWKCPPMSKNG